MTAKHRTFLLAATACLAMTATAQQLPAPAREIPLYPGIAPGSENWHYEERVAGTQEGSPRLLLGGGEPSGACHVISVHEK